MKKCLYVKKKLEKYILDAKENDDALNSVFEFVLLINCKVQEG